MLQASWKLNQNWQQKSVPTDLIFYGFHRLKTTEQMQHSEGVSMGGNFQP